MNESNNFEDKLKTALRELRFAHQIVEDELREGWPGHGGVMFSLEAILRRGLGLPPDPDLELIEPASPKTRQTLARSLADLHTLLLVAGWLDDGFIVAVKAARDSARNQEEINAMTQSQGLPPPPPDPSRN